ncbi:MAG: efflux RND transporter permease subunit [Pseudomonadota bacterium]
MKLADVSIRRPVLATVMVGVLLVFGVWAYPRIGVDLFPNIEFPFASITAVYPGADPETIETKVVDKLEEAVSTVNGIEVLRSTSMENVGIVVIQFVLERDAAQAVQDVRDKVAAALAELPRDLEPPVVAKFDVGAMPIMTIAVSGSMPIRELTDIADRQIKQKLQTVDGVGGCDIVGGREREFHVWVDPAKLEERWLAVGDVFQALAAQNVEIPGGRLEVGDREVIVKTRGQVHSKEELESIVITAASGSPIRIRDVARVEDGEEEARSYSSLNGTAAVALVIRKQSGSNTVEVAKTVRKRLGEIAGQLPQGMKVEIPQDNSLFIAQNIHDVQFDLLFGGLLAILIVLFFLHDWRATFISAIALPTSVVATFFFIKAMGFTFNTLTMLGLSLSIGILIDDAIVVIENIHRHLEMGKTPWQAASEATAEIGLAVMATTASILAVFVPVATTSGIVGRFMWQFGMTVAFAVSVSLFVAFTLTPMLSARMLKHNSRHGGSGKERAKGALGRGIDAMLGGVDRAYRVLLGAALRHRWVTIVVALGALFGSCALASKVPMDFMGESDQGQFSVKVELPTGTGLSKTRTYAEEVAGELRAIPGVAATFLTIGGSTASEVNRGDIQVNLVPRARRTFTQDEAMVYARARLARRDGAIFAVEPVNLMGGGGGAASAMRQATIQLNIRGSDYQELNEAATKMIELMRQQGGYVDIDTSYRGGQPEIGVAIDREIAADRNVPIAFVAQTIRSLVAGDKATEIAIGGNRYDVRVRLDQEFRSRPTSLLALKTRSASGALVDMASLVRLDPGTGPAKVERQDRQRQVTVYANLEGKALGSAVAELGSAAKRLLPATLTTDFTGMGDMMAKTFRDLLAALLLAIVVVYLLLAAQFESFVHPFTIMLSLPLSLVGAIGALAIAHQPLGMMAMIGVILLMGLVTKNAILLVDYTNALRQKGMGKIEALLTAGPVRLRPILMTTTAMIFGMVPVALAISEGGEMRAPMAITVIGGLITSTLLTLVVVPVVYSLLDREKPRPQG